MTLVEFESQMDRLRNVFGDRAYTDERVRLFWREVNRFELKWFTRVVDRFLGEFRQAPLLPELREEIARHREYEHQRQKSSQVTGWEAPFIANCDYCFDKGTYLCRSKNQPGVWAFRCHCSAGRDDTRRNIPQFKAAHADEFYYVNIRNG